MNYHRMLMRIFSKHAGVGSICFGRDSSLVRGPKAGQS